MYPWHVSTGVIPGIRKWEYVEVIFLPSTSDSGYPKDFWYIGRLTV